MTDQRTIWHRHDPVVIVLGKIGQTWKVCRTCGERLEVRRHD